MPDFITIDARRVDNAMQASAPLGQPLSVADTDAAALFEDSMNAGNTVPSRQHCSASDNRRADSGAFDTEQPEHPAENTGEVLAGMSHPLDTLFGRGMDGYTPADSSRKPFPADMAGLVDRLVERILVASPQGGCAEVRITLGEGRLRNTEIRLIRTGTGQLDISLHAADAASFQTLVSARDALLDRLHALGENAHVATHSGGDEGDTSRRSRGYAGFFSDNDEEKTQ